MKQAKNYLDYIPVKNSDIPWHEDENGRVILEVRHRGPAAFVAQKAFNRPAVSKIHLEEFGSFIWKEIDGEQDICQIGQKVKEAFGESAEPLYERLCIYIRTLKENRYIRFK